MKTFRLIMLLFIFIAGCQTFKDAWDHQYNDDRADDESGEWFRDAVPNDTAKYLMSVQLRNSANKLIYSKYIIVKDTVSAYYNVNQPDSVLTLTLDCKWVNSKIYKVMYFELNNWKYTINLAESDKLLLTTPIAVKRNSLFQFGVSNF